jgi:EAL and modified HD-GYP domain-containing signal transduction protein
MWAARGLQFGTRPFKQSSIMEIFVARQPILDRRQMVVGYELLFRSGFDNFYTGSNGDHATAMTLHNSFFTIGIATLTGGKRGFVNFT